MQKTNNVKTADGAGTAVAVFTLGCKTNIYESGQICAALCAAGINARAGLFAAPVAVLNTCSVTNDAQQKSRQAVARLLRLSPECRVIVVGCAAANAPQNFADKSIFAVVARPGATEIVRAVKEALASGERRAGMGAGGRAVRAPTDINVSQDGIKEYVHETDSSQAKTRALIKIQDGCNNYCAYCIVPHLRGASRSRGVADVVREARAAVAAGAPEIVIVGIDISQFGADMGESLPQLLRALASFAPRVRLGSLHVSAVTDELLSSVAAGNVCRHFHLSLQSGADNVLRAMGRRYTADEFFAAVMKIRTAFPDAGITTDVIVGYPAETDADFEATEAFMEKCAFSDIHVFRFSPRTGTPAARLTPLAPQVLAERAARLGAVKAQLKADFAAKMRGSGAKVLLEQRAGGYFTGYAENYLRIYIDAAKPDANTVTNAGRLRIGDVVTVTVGEAFKDGAKGTVPFCSV